MTQEGSGGLKKKNAEDLYSHTHIYTPTYTHTLAILAFKHMHIQRWLFSNTSSSTLQLPMTIEAKAHRRDTPVLYVHDRSTICTLRRRLSTAFLPAAISHSLTRFLNDCHNVRRNPMDYGHTEEVQLSPYKNYRTETFLPVIDQFVASLDQLLQTNKHISSQLCFFCYLRELSSGVLQAAAEQLVSSYTYD